MALIKRPVVNQVTMANALKTINDYDEVSSANSETLAHYAVVVEQLLGEKRQDEKLADYVIRKSDKKNSWFVYRSSVRSKLTSIVKKLANEHTDAINRYDQKAINACEKNLSNLLTEIEEISSHHFVTTKRTISKRNQMKGLPNDWVELICKTVGEKYRLACIVMGITGCRPQELSQGITIIKNGSELTFSILGAKVKRNGRIRKDGKVINYNAGQKVRHLTFAFDETQPLIRMLLKDLPKLRRKNNSIVVKFENKKSFASAVREAGKKLWPRRKNNITPIMFRHQFASNNKASMLLSDVEQSAAAGHIVTDTKKKYGHRSQKRSGLIPVKVLASDLVKVSRPMSTADYLSKSNEYRKKKRKLH